MSSANPFETRAADNDAWVDAHPAQFESERRTIRILLPERRGVWVEIGVGTGQLESRLGVELGIEPTGDGCPSRRPRRARRRWEPPRICRL